MHIQNNTTATAEPLSAQWIYDTLMEEIEPDLTSANIKHADERYTGESPEDKKARYERYAFAFILFNECLQDLEVDMHFDALDLKQMMTAMAMEKSQKSDQAVLRKVEDSLNSDTNQ